MPQATIAAILDRLATRPPSLPSSRLLCIDGPSGSGKTTLATVLVSQLRVRSGEDAVRLLHMDDVYQGWDGLAEAGQRLRDQVFAPMAAGRTGSYRRYDWHRAALAERRVVPPADLLVLEGGGSGSTLLDPYRTLLVWVEAPGDLRRRRGLARDGDSYAPFWETWAAQEATHFARHRTKDRADLRLDATGSVV